MELKQFQGLALRTESTIEGITLHRENLATLLQVVVEVTEILDGIKKAAFYNKTTKLTEQYANRLGNIQTLVEKLSNRVAGRGVIESVIDHTEANGHIDPRVFHGILGIVTESGELTSALLKTLTDDTQPIDPVNIQEEMSDIAWYKAILHDTLGLDWNQGLINVINKLRVRYPDKYSDEAADNRDLERERLALEGNFDAGRENFENEMEAVHAARAWPLPHIGDTAEAVTLPHDGSEPTIWPYWNAPAGTQRGLVKHLDVKDERRVFYIELPEGISSEDALAVIKTEMENRAIAKSAVEV